MSGFSNLMRHALAAMAAIVISTTLLANTLAVNSAEVHSVAGILA